MSCRVTVTLTKPIQDLLAGGDHVAWSGVHVTSRQHSGGNQSRNRRPRRPSGASPARRWSLALSGHRWCGMLSKPRLPGRRESRRRHQATMQRETGGSVDSQGHGRLDGVVELPSGEELLLRPVGCHRVDGQRRAADAGKRGGQSGPRTGPDGDGPGRSDPQARSGNNRKRPSPVTALGPIASVSAGVTMSENPMPVRRWATAPTST
jgi:hypothetical protein